MNRLKKIARKIIEGGWMQEHISTKRLTIYGRNAMHWGINVKLRKGWLCTRLPLPCFGIWWRWYFYISPDGTPTRRTWTLYYRDSEHMTPTLLRRLAERGSDE